MEIHDNVAANDDPLVLMDREIRACLFFTSYVIFGTIFILGAIAMSFCNVDVRICQTTAIAGVICSLISMYKAWKADRCVSRIICEYRLDTTKQRAFDEYVRLNSR